MKKLTGRIAVITGGSSGIGLATARLMLSKGATVYITGRRQKELDEAVAELGDNVTALQGDVANIADLNQLWATVRERSGSVDIIVTSASIAPSIALEDATFDYFDSTFDVNARGTFFAVQKGLPFMKEGGAIVLVAGDGHMTGWPDFTFYAGSKAAVRSFARILAAGLVDRGIRVNSVSPGPVDTPMLDSLGPDGASVREGLISTVPMGRLGQPVEVARAILFLASDDGSFITGEDIAVDGGAFDL
ncbi:SDR family NAD(P)-dependent oxidoreductase [Arthrobacter ruber]|uniref:SDR family NAD(P)-dependent oxidoreductase n=1 Tax=Arthrobacter ruber TaxID=1258893 RepID=UPI000CF4AF92|nr:SDR family oxidoreductase [Arthrobacter ruber]